MLNIHISYRCINKYFFANLQTYNFKMIKILFYFQSENDYKWERYQSLTANV